MPGRRWIDQSNRNAWPPGVVLALDQRHCRAEAGKPGIESHKIAEAYADAAKPHGKTGRFSLWQNQRAASLGKPRGKAAWTDFIEHGHRRNGQRKLQYFADGHRPLEAEIQILPRLI